MEKLEKASSPAQTGLNKLQITTDFHVSPGGNHRNRDPRLEPLQKYVRRVPKERRPDTQGGTLLLFTAEVFGFPDAPLWGKSKPVSRGIDANCLVLKTLRVCDKAGPQILEQVLTRLSRCWLLKERGLLWDTGANNQGRTSPPRLSPANSLDVEPTGNLAMQVHDSGVLTPVPDNIVDGILKSGFGTQN